MHLRTTPYTPSPASDVYDCGRPVRMLRASLYHWSAVTARFQAVKEQADSSLLKAEQLAMAVMVYILWDDETVGWDTAIDSESLLDLSDEALIDAGRTIARELYSLQTFLRLGISVDMLAEAFLANLQGNRPKALPLPATI